MGDKRDYYEVIGVARDAPAAEIRKAYKKLALKYHPDRNKGSKDAEQHFKEVTEAYQVLSNEEKRGLYDRFGHAGLEGMGGFSGGGGGGDIFSHFQDIFSDFFGGMGGFGGSRGRHRGPARGRDLRVTQRLSLEEAVLGCKKEIELTSPVACERCGGTGAEPGSRTKRCPTCQGQGQITTAQGFVMFTQTCPACGGEGETNEDPCETCDGVGWEEKTRKVTVSFPPGIDGGHRLRVAGQGMPGARGGPAGNLYVDVELRPHDRFEREGDDLIIRKTITFPEAALGTTVPVKMLDGSTHRVTLEPGTQPGSVITTPGKGAPRVNRHGQTGALHVVVQVAVPTRLSKRAKKLLHQLEEELRTTEAVKSA